ncbi:tRNA 2-thiouridine synthesizing protein C [Marinobacter daqiaonensis]|uniref:tRNA 2-thiouridine synthesizing protein C n=1 Tax=Marinobacter daqiaonensis TaxID=650891 RepID=A0A1I6GUU1_9GAMM|nr:DsrE family protein [Marinobacter daqiaonensis]SFR45930.1 tRNA 2-thiouridine synthesizing protein C [Marinobacter daqiaonensis]
MTDSAVLVVIDQPPYGDWQGREALDMAFSLAAFDRPVALLFRGPGVNWLRPGQDAGPLGQKTVSRNLGAATIFGVEALYADTTSLAHFGLRDMEPPAETVSPDAAFYRSFSHVVQL